jgi:hypothetical protein
MTLGCGKQRARVRVSELNTLDSCFKDGSQRDWMGKEVLAGAGRGEEMRSSASSGPTRRAPLCLARALYPMRPSTHV